VRERLKKSATDVEGGERQRRLHEAALNCLGAFAGRKANRAESGRRAIRDRLRRRYVRHRVDRSGMIRNETEYQEASARLAEERRRLVDHRSRLKEADLSEEEIKRVSDP